MSSLRPSRCLSDFPPTDVSNGWLHGLAVLSTKVRQNAKLYGPRAHKARVKRIRHPPGGWGYPVLDLSSYSVIMRRSVELLNNKTAVGGTEHRDGITPLSYSRLLFALSGRFVKQRRRSSPNNSPWSDPPRSSCKGWTSCRTLETLETSVRSRSGHLFGERCLFGRSVS